MVEQSDGSSKRLYRDGQLSCICPIACTVSAASLGVSVEVNLISSSRGNSWVPASHSTLPQIMLSRTLCRAATAAVRPALARAAVRPAAARVAASALPSTLRTFSTSFARFEPSKFSVPAPPHSPCSELTRWSPVAALSTKLGEELQFERDNADLAAEPDFLAAFKAEGVWKASSQ